MKARGDRYRAAAPVSRIALGSVVITTACALAACGDSDLAPPSSQYGADPALPEAKNFLVPPMKVPSAESWKAGETPKVAAGLKIEALATGLMHPPHGLYAAER